MKQPKTYEQYHAKLRKRRKGFRRRNIEWEYNGDGQFYMERIKGFAKRYWKRWTRRGLKKELITD